MNIALNHNVLVDVEGSENNRTSYSGSNPDETVLVQAAKELDIEFVERIGNNITIKLGGGCLVHYEMLNRFDFTSERKRSSIIVRDSDGLIKLYMKGADNVILSKINTFSKQHLFTKTCEHVDKFAKDGLRTLCYSVKVLNENEYQTFNAKFQLLQSQCWVDKSKMRELEELIAQIESDMLLLGVTALEDVLQDNVKSVIKEFIEANINVWMLTGDKLDTAESIGYSCKLLMEDTEVFKIRDTDITNIEQVLMGIKSEIDEGLMNSAKILNEQTTDNKVVEVACDDNNNNNINDNITNEQAFNSERQLLKRNNTRSSSFRFKNRLSFRSKLLSRQINLSKLKNELTHTKSIASQPLDYNNNNKSNNN
jgi:magnesium-transporting ATPase (P-type)